MPQGRRNWSMTVKLGGKDYKLSARWSMVSQMYFVTMTHEGVVILSNKGLTVMTDLLATTRLFVGTVKLMPKNGAVDAKAIRKATPTPDNLNIDNELIYETDTI